MQEVMWTIIMTANGSVVYASFFEWALHRFVMHKPWPGILNYAFRAHALVHHQVFRADLSYESRHGENMDTIPMAWWNGPVLVALSSIPWAVLSWYKGTWLIWLTSALTIAAYYGTYEYIHWCMHLPLPKRRLVEKVWPLGWLFRRLNGHHILHHRYMHKNFNVVFPLADLCLGTLLLRSKVRFPQPTPGPRVPNLQPLEQ